MEHIAIMKKSWGLTGKILTGQKKIESRWYLTKRQPWGCAKAGETVYFKNSGEPIRIKAQIKKVLRFVDLTPKRVREILNKYGKEDGLEKNKLPYFSERFKNKKYCLLIFLKNPQEIKPFNIDKTGFGMMSAWISLKNISKVKK